MDSRNSLNKIRDELDRDEEKRFSPYACLSCQALRRIDEDNIAEGHRQNFTNLGYYACPCRETFGIRDKDKDIICPCEYAQADIDEHGHCYCALFTSEQFNSSGREAESIPERRPESLMP